MTDTLTEAVGLDALVEELAQFLHDEIEFPDKCVGYVWPLHDNDDGYRGEGAWAKLQPKDVVEHFRDAAKQIVRRFAALRSPAPAGREEVARIIDPEAWADRDRLQGFAEKNGVHPADVADLRADADRIVEPSLAKADRILSLADPKAKDAETESVG